MKYTTHEHHCPICKGIVVHTHLNKRHYHQDPLHNYHPNCLSQNTLGSDEDMEEDCDVEALMYREPWA